MLAAGKNENPHEAEAALAELCQAYWAPLYTFVRSRGHPPHDAQDLTQGFFAHLVEHRIYAQVDPRKGKFRSFLLAAMKNFLANARAHDRTQKRGGAHTLLPLGETTVQEVEKFYQSQHAARSVEMGADRCFERSWAQTVVDAATAHVERTYLADGKRTLFDVLKPFVAGDARTLPAYDQVAATLDVPVPIVRSHVSRLRQRFREALYAEVRRTVDSHAEVREEISILLRALTAD